MIDAGAGGAVNPRASMKVPPKRKGNAVDARQTADSRQASMKVPPKRKGNLRGSHSIEIASKASMKVPPKRKGNAPPGSSAARQ